MRYSLHVTSAAVASLSFGLASAQECSETISASAYPAPSLAEGWSAHIVANDFTKPRSLKLDSSGHLLVVDQDDTNGGVYRLSFTGEAPCLTVSDRQQIIANGSVSAHLL